MTGRQCPDDGSVTVRFPKSAWLAVVALLGGTGYNAIKPTNEIVIPAITQQKIDTTSSGVESLKSSNIERDRDLALMQHDVKGLANKLDEFIDETKESRKEMWKAINEKRTP